MIAWLARLTLPQAAGYALVLNFAMFLVALGVGHVLVRRYGQRRVTAEPDPVEAAEVLLAVSCVLLNSVVAVFGWWLWRRGVIVLRDEVGRRVVRDAAVLLVVMDLAMYVMHRVAHHRWLFPIVHRTHHRYDRPRPLNLFVLNPFEVLGFGALWLAVLSVYPFTWFGMIAFLSLNLAFGTLGHLGVEPFPKSWKRLPILRHVGSSTFHADHHQHEHVNYGFYSDVWDRLFRTQK
jgi:sterol desaturase/sphingolipid hydroxylase (fatty acid hydroxylase superfamily)